MSKVGVQPSDRLLYSSGSVARRKCLVHSSLPHTIAGVRTPILRKHVCSLSSFGGSDTATGCGSFYTLHSFTGRWWCVEKACIRFRPAAVALRFAAFLTFLPATTSPAICAPVASARFPKATAPRLIRGATVRRRPLNKLPNPCPLWTRAR